jgi:hypothetical protein
MPGFFFHLQEGQLELHDDEPQDFPGIVEAEKHARNVANELARNESPSVLRKRFIVVTDIHGAEIARVALGTSHQRPKPPTSSVHQTATPAPPP